jgi:hypothetical protein
MMLVYQRGLLLSVVVAALVACSGTGGTGTSPALSGAGPGLNPAHAALSQMSPAQVAATALDSAPEVNGGREITRRLSFSPNAKSSPVLMNFVSDGPSQSGVPCITCVNGASSSDNIGLTGPSSYIPTGDTWQYSLSFTDISYKGKCKLAWAITSGKKVVDSFSATVNLSSAGGFVLYALNRGRPNYSGSATLTGKMTCGSTSQMTHAPLEFQ